MKRIKDIVIVSLLLLLASCNNEINYESFTLIKNTKGPDIGYSRLSGVTILKSQGAYFKDLNKNGALDPYEDWRLSARERAVDLAGRMTNEQITGLMIQADHQEIDEDTLSAIQEGLVKLFNRHILIDHVKNPEIAARWNNNAQLLAESMELGIPLNNSSDPRNTFDGTEGINGGAGGQISIWPESIGLAATFDPQIVREYGEIASKEYRALGIGTALSPQVDLVTEPRWFRTPGTFGESAQLSADMAKAYIDGFQTSLGKSEIESGWGYHSVNCMVKHWPGGGPVESGRDAHYPFGKYAVYPGNNFNTHLIPFLDGAFKLDGPTGYASAVMPYYTISFNQDTIYGENVGNSFSKYIVTDLLLNKYKYEGVVCTDWHIMGGRKWGVEKLRTTQRYHKAFMAGVDQIGGVNDPKRLLMAFDIAKKEKGQEWLRDRIETSAIKLLINIFRLGLFENPYLIPDESMKILGEKKFVEAGYVAQQKSVVLLKNKGNILPLSKKIKVYVPKIYTPGGKDPMGKIIEEKYDYPVSLNVLNNYFQTTENPAEADVAVVFVKGPIVSLGYERKGEGYVPISLQYNPYKAEYAREVSLAPDDLDDPENSNRSYKGRSATASNYKVLETILETKKAMGNKPVIVSMALTNPAIVAEFENEIDALLVSFSVQPQALLDLVTGKVEPSGLLPFQMPADMITVEQQQEDVPFDMNCYRDTEGNVYDFAFGMNWSGVIHDKRTQKYGRNSN